MQCPILFTYWRQYCSLWRQHFSLIKTAWLSVAYSTAGVCERWRWTFWTPFCNRDSFADCSLDLTLIVSFWKIAFLVCRWKQIISLSRNWTHLQSSTQCSNGCQCVLCNFQWFLFSIISVRPTVLYIGSQRRLVQRKLEWWGCWRKYDVMLSCFNTSAEHDGGTDRIAQ